MQAWISPFSWFVVPFLFWSATLRAEKIDQWSFWDVPLAAVLGPLDGLSGR